MNFTIVFQRLLDWWAGVNDRQYVTMVSGKVFSSTQLVQDKSDPNV